MFDESKFFSYMRPELVTLLLDISEFGLDALLPTLSVRKGVTPVGPRFYMRYADNYGVVLFMPGEREGITASSPVVDTDIDYSDDEEMEKEVESDRALAEEFDARLCDEVSRFRELGKLAGRKIAGWSGFMLNGDLEQKQLL